MRLDLKENFLHKLINNPMKRIGIFLIIIGFILVYTNLLSDYNISIALIFIGLIFLLIINREKTYQDINDKELAFLIIFLILITLIISIGNSYDIFIILTTIGIIILKEFLSKYLNEDLQKRLQILFYILLVLFIIIYAKRVISLSDIYLS